MTESWKKYVEKIGPVEYKIKKGFVPNMRVEGRFYVNDGLKELLYDELVDNASRSAQGGFMPAVLLAFLENCESFDRSGILLSRPLTLTPSFAANLVPY